MKIYIANLGKYNEGILQGDWFDLPVDYQDMKNRIGLNEQAVIVHELLNQGFTLEEIEDLQNFLFSSLEELYEKKEELIIYENCTSIEDVAQSLIDEGMLGDIPEKIKNYIDYQKLGRDLELEGSFLVCEMRTFERA